MGARSFVDIVKDATAASVHVDSALGGKRKAKTFDELRTGIAKRNLQPHDADTAKSPFLYDPNALGQLRPDQVPRFFGALTDSDKLPEAEVPLGELHAMQDRVDPAKVKAIQGSSVAPAKLPVVVQVNGRKYIADGHHRLTAQWLDGETTARVKIKDLEPVSNFLKAGDKRWTLPVDIRKTVPDQQMLFGWASIATIDGHMVIDKQGHAIPPEELENAAYQYVLNSRLQGDMHETIGTGRMIESMVFTKEKQEILKIDLGCEGWWTGFKVEHADTWAAHKRGERAEFSIGGTGRLIPAGATVQ